MLSTTTGFDSTDWCVACFACRCPCVPTGQEDWSDPIASGLGPVAQLYGQIVGSTAQGLWAHGVVSYTPLATPQCSGVARRVSASGPPLPAGASQTHFGTVFIWLAWVSTSVIVSDGAPRR